MSSATGGAWGDDWPPDQVDELWSTVLISLRICVARSLILASLAAVLAGSRAPVDAPVSAANAVSEAGVGGLVDAEVETGRALSAASSARIADIPSLRCREASQRERFEPVRPLDDPV